MIKKRKVIFIPGLDLRSDEYYHRNFCKESKKQERINDYFIEASPIKKKNNPHFSSWEVCFREGENQTITDYDFFCWHDSMQKNPFKKGVRFLLPSIKAFYIIFLNLSSFFIMKSNKMLKSYYAYLKPYILLFSSIFIFMISLIGSLLFASKGLFFIAVFMASLSFIVRNNSVIKLIQLQITATNFLGNISKSPKQLTSTINILSQYIIAELSKNEYDEILICSHSTGSILAIKTISNLLDNNVDLSNLSLLSLGSTAPVFYILSLAKNKRYIFYNELHNVIENQVVWFDVTSLADGAAFAMFEYPKDNKKYPIKISPQFHKALSPNYYEKIKKNVYQLHFQYLCAGHKKVPYDFFNLILGKEGLLNQSE